MGEKLVCPKGFIDGKFDAGITVGPEERIRLGAEVIKLGIVVGRGVGIKEGFVVVYIVGVELCNLVDETVEVAVGGKLGKIFSYTDGDIDGLVDPTIIGAFVGPTD